MDEAQQEQPEVDPLAGWITEEAGGVTVLRLEEPVSIGSSAAVDRLRFVPLKAKHLRCIKEGLSNADLLDIAAARANESPRVMGELGVNDGMRVIGAMRRDFGLGPASGEGS